MQTNDTTPHGPASPPYSYSSLQIGSLRGLVAPRKCTQAWRAGEGERRSGHSPAGPRPGGPREARGPGRQGRGSCRSGADSGPPSPSFLLRPFHVGHRAAGHVGGREPGRAWAQRPGVALASSGPLQARGAGLPPTPPGDSNFLLGPRAGRFCLPGRRGQARAGHRGHLRSPNSDLGDHARALAERRRWLWVRGEGAHCAGTCSGCVPYEKRNIFYTLKKEMFLPVAWISPGLFLKPCLGWERPASRDRGALRPGGPESANPGLARRPSAAESPRRPDAPSLDTKPGDPGRAPTAPGLNSMPVTRGVGAGFAAVGRRALFLRPRAPQTLISLP